MTAAGLRLVFAVVVFLIVAPSTGPGMIAFGAVLLWLVVDLGRTVLRYYD